MSSVDYFEKATNKRVVILVTPYLAKFPVINKNAAKGYFVTVLRRRPGAG